MGATVLITGGGTGIGRATALLFGERRAMLAGRRAEPLEATAAEVRRLGAQAD